MHTWYIYYIYTKMNILINQLHKLWLCKYDKLPAGSIAGQKKMFKMAMAPQREVNFSCQKGFKKKIRLFLDWHTLQQICFKKGILFLFTFSSRHFHIWGSQEKIKQRSKTVGWYYPAPPNPPHPRNWGFCVTVASPLAQIRCLHSYLWQEQTTLFQRQELLSCAKDGESALKDPEHPGCFVAETPEVGC